MAAPNSITSVNTIFMLAVTDLFTVPQQLQGWSADDIFDSEQQEPAQTSTGLDGVLSAGYVPVPTRMTIVLQSDSASNVIFEQWKTAMDAAREVYRANGVVNIGSIRRSYLLTRGVLVGYPPTPKAAKMLQPRSYVIMWESCIPSPI